MMVLASTMGRAAVFGPGWTPSSILARKIACAANEGSTMVAPAWQPVAQRGSQPQSSNSLGTGRQQRPAAITPTVPGGFHFFRDPAADTPTASMGSLQEHLRRELPGASNAESEERRAKNASSMASRFKPVSMDPPKMAWVSMLPRKDLGLRQAMRLEASAPLLSSSASVNSSPQSRSSPKCIAFQESKQQELLPGYTSSRSAASRLSDRPASAPDGPTSAKLQGNSSTNHWRPTEVSLGRDSLNCIVRGCQMDTPQSIQRQTSMSRTAMMRATTRG